MTSNVNGHIFRNIGRMRLIPVPIDAELNVVSKNDRTKTRFGTNRRRIKRSIQKWTKRKPESVPIDAELNVVPKNGQNEDQILKRS